MTDFGSESSFAGIAGAMPRMVWGSDAEGSFEPPPAPPVQRSAAALAAATHQLLEALVAKRVPRVEGLRGRLRAALPGDLGEMAHAVRVLHAGMEALDFLAARGDERLPHFLQQGEAVVAASERLAALADGFVRRHATDLPVVRLLWIELVLESDSMRKRVRQGAHWLAQMNRDLAPRRRAASVEVTRQALDELARRGTALHQRLQTVHRMCGHARSIHGLCEQLLEQRTALCTTLQATVGAAAADLHAALRPLLDAARYRPLVPEELMGAIEAQHAVQVGLTQAAAQLERMLAGEQELHAELAGMEDKAASLA